MSQLLSAKAVAMKYGMFLLSPGKGSAGAEPIVPFDGILELAVVEHLCIGSRSVSSDIDP